MYAMIKKKSMVMGKSWDIMLTLGKIVREAVSEELSCERSPNEVRK